MSLPDALSRAATDRLRPPGSPQVGVPALPAPGRPRPAAGAAARTTAVRLARAAVHRAEEAGLLAGRVAAERAEHRLDGLESTVRDQQVQLALAAARTEAAAVEAAAGRAAAESVAADVARLAHDLAALGAEQARLHAELAAAAAETRTVVTNLELLKDEVRAGETRLLDLGMAIAPATGLTGAGARLSELRERVNGLDRRVRDLTGRAGGPSDSTAAAPATPSTGDARLIRPAVRPASALPPAAALSGAARSGGADDGPSSALFDYAGFELRFRGDPQVVADALWERYGELLAAHQPVVDLGCGRAELLARLAERGVTARGVDTDPTMVADARARGLDVEQADALGWLRAQPEQSLGAVVATHVAEHLPLDALIELLELSVTRLKPGGVLVAETPNPATLVVLGNSYVLDPTHVRPLHPSLLSFLCEGAGFRDVRLLFFSPAESYRLRSVAGEDPLAPRWAHRVDEELARLNEVLFGPQEYAVVATAPPA